MAPLEMGDEAPGFDGLLGVDGQRHSLTSFDGKQVLVIIFSCNGCPTVKAAEDRLIAIQDTYAPGGVQLIAINSNNSYLSPADTYPEMVTRTKEKGFNFPYLKDEERRVARSYGAVRTPHVFVFDHDRKLRYRGRIDDSRDPAKVTSRDLQKGLEEILASKAVRVPETEPFGCAIVW
jgi:peroxiredoxin